MFIHTWVDTKARKHTNLCACVHLVCVGARICREGGFFLDETDDDVVVVVGISFPPIELALPQEEGTRAPR